MHGDQAKPRTRRAAEGAASHPYVLYHCHLALSAVSLPLSCLVWLQKQRARQFQLRMANARRALPRRTRTHRRDKTRRDAEADADAGTRQAQTLSMCRPVKGPRAHRRLAACAHPCPPLPVFHRPSLGATSTTHSLAPLHTRARLSDRGQACPLHPCVLVYMLCSTVTMSC
jgi:hypothetical protein